MAHEHSTTLARVGLLTISDTRTIDTDKSGAVAVELLTSSGHEVVERDIVQDEKQHIEAKVRQWSIDPAVQVMILTGGTGPSPRDVTPDCIEPLLQASIPGFGELFRVLSYQEIGSAAMLSRALGGWIDENGYRKPIFALPGSPKAVRLALEKIILPEIGHLLDVCSDGARA